MGKFNSHRGFFSRNLFAAMFIAAYFFTFFCGHLAFANNNNDKVETTFAGQNMDMEHPMPSKACSQCNSTSITSPLNSPRDFHLDLVKQISEFGKLDSNFLPDHKNLNFIQGIQKSQHSPPKINFTVISRRE